MDCREKWDLWGRGFDGGMGGNGTDSTPGTKGGKGGRGGDGGEAGEWSLEALPEVPLSAFVIRTGGLGGAGGAGGLGGSRAFGGAGGEGGVGGQGGEGGPPGARGYCKSQNRMWTAYKNWHDTHHCKWHCGCSSHKADDPCSDFAVAPDELLPPSVTTGRYLSARHRALFASALTDGGSQAVD